MSAEPVPGPVWAIVVAGGSGARFGGPKQFEDLGGRRLLDWAVATATEACDGVVAVLPADRVHEPSPGADIVVAGGRTRSTSVRAGLAAVPPEAGVVVVHDAARPLAPLGLFRAVIDAVRAEADGAVPGVPVPDTIKVVSGAPGEPARPVVATPARDSLVAVQTPQAFRADVLRRAHAEGGEASDDAALVEAVRGVVVVVPGDPAAHKVTTPDDLEHARRVHGGAP